MFFSHEYTHRTVEGALFFGPNTLKKPISPAIKYDRGSHPLPKLKVLAPDNIISYRNVPSWKIPVSGVNPSFCLWGTEGEVK